MNTQNTPYNDHIEEYIVNKKMFDLKVIAFALFVLCMAFSLSHEFWLRIIGEKNAVLMSMISTSILVFLPLGNKFFCIVPANKAWVLSNAFISETAQYREEFTGEREIKAQRELQAGFHLRFPWEKVVYEVDMSLEKIIESDRDDIYTLMADSNGVSKMVIIRWRISYVVLPGSVVNFTRTDPEIIVKSIKARATKSLQSYFGERSDIGYGKMEQDNFKKYFEEIFGGPKYIDPYFERRVGIWTGTPEIIDIDLPRKHQEIQNILSAVLDIVKKSDNKLSFNDAQKMVLAANQRGDDLTQIRIV